MTSVGVVKDLPDGGALGGLREADHVLWAADLDEGEARVLGNLGGQSSLARVRSSLQQYGDQAGVPGQRLLDRQSAVLEDLLDVLAPVDDAARDEGLQQVLGAPQGGLDVVLQRVQEVSSGNLRRITGLELELSTSCGSH